MRLRSALVPLAAAAAVALPLPALAASPPPATTALGAYAARVGASVRWNPATDQLFVVWGGHAWLVYPVDYANLPGETAANTAVSGSTAGDEGPTLYLPEAVLEADMPPAPVQPAPPPASSPAPAADGLGAQLTAILRGTLGDPYVWGGTSPLGFDCSGLVQWAFAQVGVDLPRTTFEQWDAGTPVASPAPGDLVFFQTYAPGPSHVGVYLGGGTFIDAGDVAVQLDTLSAPYWASRYLGARAVLPA